MQVSTHVDIGQPTEKVWAVVTDIDNAGQVISSIDKVEIIEKPVSGMVGLKWRETRKMFGKEATEVMWVTEAETNQFYCTRAESHGSIYLTRISMIEANGVTTLTMTFSAQPQTFVAKILSTILNRFITKSLVTELNKDLNDIKQYLEKNRLNWPR